MYTCTSNELAGWHNRKLLVERHGCVCLWRGGVIVATSLQGGRPERPGLLFLKLQIFDAGPGGPVASWEMGPETVAQFLRFPFVDTPRSLHHVRNCDLPAPSACRRVGRGGADEGPADGIGLDVALASLGGMISCASRWCRRSANYCRFRRSFIGEVSVRLQLFPGPFRPAWCRITHQGRCGLVASSSPAPSRMGRHGWERGSRSRHLSRSGAFWLCFKTGGKNSAVAWMLSAYVLSPLPSCTRLGCM